MAREPLKDNRFFHIGIIVLTSLVLGGVIQWILPVGSFIKGSGAAVLLLLLCGLVLYLAWRKAGQGKKQQTDCQRNQIGESLHNRSGRRPAPISLYRKSAVRGGLTHGVPLHATLI